MTYLTLKKKPKKRKTAVQAVKYTDVHKLLSILFLNIAKISMTLET